MFVVQTAPNMARSFTRLFVLHEDRNQAAVLDKKKKEVLNKTAYKKVAIACNLVIIFGKKC